MSVKLYYDLLSQPSRALYIFLKITNIPFEEKQIALRKGEHFKEEFKDISRFQKVPVIHHNNFKLTESVAILRYICREFSVPDNWYPRDSHQQARVDEYLEWQHNNTRLHCSMYFQQKWLIPLVTGKPIDKKRLEGYETRMKECLNVLETVWLAENSFLAGDEISAADIWGACELEQLRMCNYDPGEDRPMIRNWMNRVRSITNPHYDVAHSIVKRIAEKTRMEKAKL